MVVSFMEGELCLSHTQNSHHAIKRMYTLTSTTQLLLINALCTHTHPPQSRGTPPAPTNSLNMHLTQFMRNFYPHPHAMVGPWVTASRRVCPAQPGSPCAPSANNLSHVQPSPAERRGSGQFFECVEPLGGWASL